MTSVTAHDHVARRYISQMGFRLRVVVVVMTTTTTMMMMMTTMTVVVEIVRGDLHLNPHLETEKPIVTPLIQW